MHSREGKLLTASGGMESLSICLRSWRLSPGRKGMKCEVGMLCGGEVCAVRGANVPTRAVAQCTQVPHPAGHGPFAQKGGVRGGRGMGGQKAPRKTHQGRAFASAQYPWPVSVSQAHTRHRTRRQSRHACAWWSQPWRQPRNPHPCPAHAPFHSPRTQGPAALQGTGHHFGGGGGANLGAATREDPFEGASATASGFFLRSYTPDGMWGKGLVFGTAGRPILLRLILDLLRRSIEKSPRDSRVGQTLTNVEIRVVPCDCVLQL